MFNTVPNFAGFIPSSAKSILFGVKVWMILVPIIDPINGQQINKLLIWDGKKWFASNQGINLTYIQHQEISSVLAAWGTDGFSLFQLFQLPSTTFTKTVQSKLWDKPIGYQMTKTVGRLYGIVQFFSQNGASLSVSIDNELGAASNLLTIAMGQVIVVNASGTVIPVQNALGHTVIVLNTSTSGFTVIEPTAVGQQGHLIGMTAETTASDMAIVSLMIQPEIALGPG